MFCACRSFRALLVFALASFAAHRPAEATLVTVDALEATQALQSLQAETPIPLIAGKPLVVRFYLSSQERVLFVRGWLRAENAAGDILYLSSEKSARVLPAGQLDLAERRKDAPLSLNFFLKPTYVQEGLLSLRLEQVVDSSTGEILAWKGSGDQVVTIERDVPLRLALLSVPVRRGVQIQVPGELDLRAAESWLQRAYPVGGIIASQRFIASGDSAFRDAFSCHDVNALLLAARNLDLSSGADPRTHYYGMLHRLAGPKWGCALGIPAAGESLPPVASGLNRVDDTVTSDAGWYAGHELAHTFGLRHITCTEEDPCCRACNERAALDREGDFIGWDSGDPEAGILPKVLPGDHRDITSYCDRNLLWVGPRTYRTVRERLVEENRLSTLDLFKIPLPAGLFAAFPTSPNIPYLNIVGFKSGTSARKAFYLIPLVLPPVPPGISPQLTVEVQGTPNLSNRVWGRAYKESCPGGSVYFDVLVPMTEVATGVRIRWGREWIYSLRFGPEPPRIENVRLLPEQGGRATLVWKGEDPDDTEDVHYSVQQSRDGGHTWETIALGLQATRLSLMSDPRQHAEETKLRILATDGLNITIAEARDPLGGAGEDH